PPRCLPYPKLSRKPPIARPGRLIAKPNRPPSPKAKPFLCRPRRSSTVGLPSTFPLNGGKLHGQFSVRLGTR
ncbi:hypothetical protein CORC01_03144, partial [Colletotrichum orchidophilum]